MWEIDNRDADIPTKAFPCSGCGPGSDLPTAPAALGTEPRSAHPATPALGTWTDYSRSCHWQSCWKTPLFLIHPIQDLNSVKPKVAAAPRPQGIQQGGLKDSKAAATETGGKPQHLLLVDENKWVCAN